MSHLELTSRVGADGVLRISVPFGPSEANREVKIIVELKDANVPLPAPSRDEWRSFVEDMAGCISDPTFKRPEQGEYERRGEVFQ